MLAAYEAKKYNRKCSFKLQHERKVIQGCTRLLKFYPALP